MNIATANRLVQYRKERGLSQEDLAAELGLSRQAVSKWERAEASPDTDNLIALARLYGVSLDTLLLADTPPQPAPVPSIDAMPPPPAAPDVVELLGDKVNEAICAEIADVFVEEENRGTVSRLSPAARRLVDLMILGAFAVFFLICGFTRFIFPQMMGAYPIIVTILYLLLGFFADWWHPGWIMYLSIPLYYIFFG